LITSSVDTLTRIRLTVAQQVLSSVLSVYLALTREIVQIEEKTEKFWAALEAYPMHLTRLPKNIDVDFLGALSFGASGKMILMCLSC
jgi:hypothetical protein